MSATEIKDNKIVPKGAKLPVHQLNPSYTVRVICCVLFIFLAEIFLAHYIYRLINSEIRENYLSKHEFRQNFQNEIRTESFREEVIRIITYMKIKQESDNNQNVELGSTSNTRSKRSTGRNLEYNFLADANLDDVYPEYTNPKVRSVLDETGDPRRKPSTPGDNNPDSQWIWVSSTSRIPEKTLEGYCKKFQEFCPQKPGAKGDRGITGLPGIMGPPGPKGDQGPSGQMGNTGLPGFPGTKGEPGYKGEKGDPGRSGLDGRVGTPGSPGLFGRPGRNGYDGVPGKNGMPGRDGRDGSNGQKGERGTPGPQGPKGERGIHGPKGKPGRSGINGTPGLPGITAYEYRNKNISALLIPPSIAGAQKGPMGPIVVQEGENVRLHCSATGTPAPHITWQKLDNRPINRGAWQDAQISGATLNLTHVNREHMGKYLCIADNGIPPTANQTFNLEVHFSPLISIQSQMVGVANGSTAVLECDIEAFPEPIRYWERSDGRLLESSDKFRIDNSKVKYRYKSRMQLNISRVSYHDMQYLYYCISKNELKMAKGEFKLYEIDPREPNPPKTSFKPTIFGVQPPDKVALEDLCEPVQCPKCDIKEVKCSPGGVSLIDLISRWEVRPYGDTKYSHVGLTRGIDCVLYAVGKPVYHRFADYNYGCWMKDPGTETDGEKIWLTTENDTTTLYEFRNKTMFRKDQWTRNYTMDHPFGGNTHVIYNGSFFYNVKDTRRIIKYNLATERTVSLDLPGSMDRTTKLYSGQYNYVDFCVDDNGLWIIFAVPDSNNTAVMKVDVDQMIPQYMWNISIDHHKVGEMFIVCGVLYAVDSVTERTSKIRFALDLYKNILLDVSLQFSNPFRKTTMLGYNHRSKELYSWDKGNQLTYPVRYHEIGYNYNSSVKEERQMDTGDTPTAAKRTGYEINN